MHVSITILVSAVGNIVVAVISSSPSSITHVKQPHSKPNTYSKFLMGHILLFPLFICGSWHMYSTTLPFFFLQAFFIPSEAGLHIHANIFMEEFLWRIRFCTKLRDHISMVSAPLVRSSSAKNCFHVTPNMGFGWKALSFVDLSPKSVQSPVTDRLMLLQPPGLHWQHGTQHKVNAISLCGEPNWLTSGTPYKADSALHAELLWELSQTLLCLGKQIGKKINN